MVFHDSDHGNIWLMHIPMKYLKYFLRKVGYYIIKFYYQTDIPNIFGTLMCTLGYKVWKEAMFVFINENFELSYCKFTDKLKKKCW